MGSYSHYLQGSLGHVLTKCLADISQVRPTDPIEYMAQWLYKQADAEIYYYEKDIFRREMEKMLLGFQKEQEKRHNVIKLIKDKMEQIQSDIEHQRLKQFSAFCRGYKDAFIDLSPFQFKRLNIPDHEPIDHLDITRREIDVRLCSVRRLNRDQEEALMRIQTYNQMVKMLKIGLNTQEIPFTPTESSIQSLEHSQEALSDRSVRARTTRRRPKTGESKRKEHTRHRQPDNDGESENSEDLWHVPDNFPGHSRRKSSSKSHRDQDFEEPLFENMDETVAEFIRMTELESEDERKVSLYLGRQSNIDPILTLTNIDPILPDPILPDTIRKSKDKSDRESREKTSSKRASDTAERSKSKRNDSYASNKSMIRKDYTIRDSKRHSSRGGKKGLDFLKKKSEPFVETLKWEHKRKLGEDPLSGHESDVGPKSLLRIRKKRSSRSKEERKERTSVPDSTRQMSIPSTEEEYIDAKKSRNETRRESSESRRSKEARSHSESRRSKEARSHSEAVSDSAQENPDDTEPKIPVTKPKRSKRKKSKARDASSKKNRDVLTSGLMSTSFSGTESASDGSSVHTGDASSVNVADTSNVHSTESSRYSRSISPDDGQRLSSRGSRESRRSSSSRSSREKLSCEWSLENGVQLVCTHPLLGKIRSVHPRPMCLFDSPIYWHGAGWSCYVHYDPELYIKCEQTEPMFPRPGPAKGLGKRTPKRLSATKPSPSVRRRTMNTK